VPRSSSAIDAAKATARSRRPRAEDWAWSRRACVQPTSRKDSERTAAVIAGNPPGGGCTPTRWGRRSSSLAGRFRPCPSPIA
jgi:hypothetical protein